MTRPEPRLAVWGEREEGSGKVETGTRSHKQLGVGSEEGEEICQWNF